jgi:hypothetical protein
MAYTMASRLLAEAGRTGVAIAGVARHLAWYLSYHFDPGGSARVGGDAERARKRRATRRER